MVWLSRRVVLRIVPKLSLLLLLIYSECLSYLSLLFDQVFQPLLELIQFILQLLLFVRVGLSTEELFHRLFHIETLIIDELGDLVQRQIRIFAGIVVFILLM